jgi:hypothetical protein
MSKPVTMDQITEIGEKVIETQCPACWAKAGKRCGYPRTSRVNGYHVERYQKHHQSQQHENTGVHNNR